METDPLNHSPEKKVTFVELFFDLVFVFSVTQVVTILHHGIDSPTVGKAILIFWLVWWAWTQFTWTLNAANTERPRTQLVLLATGTAFLMAVAVPEAFGDRALWFASTYAVVRIIGLTLQYMASFEISGMRSALNTWMWISVAGLGAVLVGAVVGGTAQYWIWGLAIIVDLVAAGLGGRADGWHLKPAHFAERHGLFVIIALGETLIVAATAVTGADWTVTLMTVGILAVATTSGLWWTYFQGAAEMLEAGFDAASGARQAQIARDSYSLIHFLMLGGVIFYAVAIEEAVSHPTGVLPPVIALALGAGIVLFPSGMAAALWRATGEIRLTRIAIAFATGLSIWLLRVDTVTSLAIAFIGVLLIGILERE